MQQEIMTLDFLENTNEFFKAHPNVILSLIN